MKRASLGVIASPATSDRASLNPGFGIVHGCSNDSTTTKYIAQENDTTNSVGIMI